MNVFLRHLCIVLLIFTSEISYAQINNAPTIRLDCSPNISKKSSYLIRNSSGKEILLLDTVLITKAKLKETWIDSINVYKPSEKEVLKYGDRVKFGIILLAVKEEHFTDVLKSLGLQ